MMFEDQTTYVRLLKTGKLFEHDMVVNALSEAGIPYREMSEDIGGIRTIKGLAPRPGPGHWWTIDIPEVALEDAKSVIDQLPVERQLHPDVWDFAPESNIREKWKAVLTIFSAFVLICFLFGLFEMLLEVFLG